MKNKLWRFPLSSALAAFVLYVPFLYTKSFDLESIGYLLLLFVLTLAFCFWILVRGVAFRRWGNRTSVYAVLAFLAVSIGMFLSNQRLRPWARWLVASGRYTTLVLQQPPDPQTGLRSIEWDGWGWAGMNTSVDLVYDHKDSLAHEIRNNPKGRFAEIAEKTAFAQRLGPGWYSLTLYTGEVL